MEVTVNPVPLAGPGVQGLVVEDPRSGEAVLLPTEASASSSDPTIPYDVEFRMSLGADHRYICDELVCRRRADGEPVTATGLRLVPVPTLLAALVGRVAQPVDVLEDGTFRLRPGAQTLDVRFLARKRKRGPGRAARISDSDLPEVARLYREGKAAGQALVNIADTFGVGRSTAHRAARRAVTAGYLKAGEIPKQGKPSKRATGRGADERSRHEAERDAR